MLRKSFGVMLSALVMAAGPVITRADDKGLVGYWKLLGDARDHSGHDHHGANHGVDLKTGAFNGRGAYIEVPDAPDLRLGAGDFTIAAQFQTPGDVTDVLGDLVSKFDPVKRRGFNLTLVHNTSGYNSQSNNRHLFFGIDDGTAGKWVDCGRPGGKTHSSDALTVFEGRLYVGTVDAPDQSDWAHVYRYVGGQEWEDCGRVGAGKIRGVYAMIVHAGALYAATAGPHGGKENNTGDFGRVYRYRGDKAWEDLGQPGAHFRVNSLASFEGRLYAAAINTGGVIGGVYVHEGGTNWRKCGDFGRPHTTAVHDGLLYAAYPNGEVFAYNGQDWARLGNPLGSLKQCNQLHAHGVYQGELYVGTWPFGRVALRRNDKWIDLGRLGEATEVVGLTVYNGSFYAGTIPHAEVFRYDGPDEWASMGRLFDPPGYDPPRQVEDWTRASSLTVYRGRLYSSTATCYRAMVKSAPADDIRGKVYSFATGAAVSHDGDMGQGWNHVAATRTGAKLTLYVNGRPVAVSEGTAANQDLSNAAPLRIGFGSQSHFAGNLRHVRLFNRGLAENEIAALRADGDR